MIPDDEEKPHGGDVDKTLHELLPVLEILLSMPARGPSEGSSEWIKTCLQDMSMVTFEHMTKYPKLLRAFVKDHIADKDPKTGYVKMQPGEAIPDEDYDVSSTKRKFANKTMVLKSTRRCMQYHPNFRFLRSGGVFYALENLKTLGLRPLKMKVQTLPEIIREQGMGWNNYYKVILTFFVFYCHAQGKFKIILTDLFATSSRTFFSSSRIF